MWISPEEYARKYRISLPLLYPALRAGRDPVQNELWEELGEYGMATYMNRKKK